MKKIIIAILLACTIHAGLAQDSLKINTGNWVVESNISSPKDQLVKFYNSRLELIYQEKITGRKLKIEKLKDRKMLDKTLQIALKEDQKIQPGTLSAMIYKRR